MIATKKPKFYRKFIRQAIEDEEILILKAMPKKKVILKNDRKYREKRNRELMNSK